MKITFLSSLLFLSIYTSAQIKKGAIFLGGDISFGGSNSTNNLSPTQTSNSTSFGIGINAGKAVKENLIVGVKVGFSSINFKQDPTLTTFSKDELNSFGGGVWLRKYYTLSKAFYVFADAAMNANFGKRDQQLLQPSRTVKENSTGVSLTLFPGVAYQMRKRFFLEASLNNLLSIGYAHNTYKQTDSNGVLINSNTSNSYSGAIGFGNSNPLQIGARWILQGK